MKTLPYVAAMIAGAAVQLVSPTVFYVLAAGDRLVEMEPNTVYEFTHRLFQTETYRGDMSTDPNDRYGIRPEITGPAAVGIVVDPNIGDPNNHVTWKFDATPTELGVYDIEIGAIEDPPLTDPALSIARMFRIKVIKPKTPPTIRLLIKIDAEVEIIFIEN